MIAEEGFDPELPRHWTPAAQERFLEMMAVASEREPRVWYCQRGRTCDGNPHDQYDYQHARSDQWPPSMRDDDWDVWLMLSGRGGGKTRAGAEWIRNMTRYTGRLALVAPTAADLRDTMIEGDSGIIRCCEAQGFSPVFEPSKRRVTFPNGAMLFGYTAEEPDRLRGPNVGAAWVDEAAHYPNPEYVWDQLEFTMRLGDHPRYAVTTTPTPSDWLKGLVAEDTTRVVKVSTFANEKNLAPSYLRKLRKKHVGTRLGRQELYGEILEDVEGALWSSEILAATRVDAEPPMARIVVAIDPAGTSVKRSDETGIVVMGADVDGQIYVLEDASGQFTPDEWANAAFAAADRWHADLIVAEGNYGAEMVEANLRNYARATNQPLVRIERVNSRRGKFIRAEPVFGLFEQNRAHLVGHHADLESQLAGWVPGTGKSPDRLDAMVHAAIQLTDVGMGSVTVAKGKLPRANHRPRGTTGDHYKDLKKMKRGVLGALARRG